MKHCRICMIIRYFLVAVLFLIILLLTVSDQLHYLSFITPWNAVILIFILGGIVFLIRLFEFIKSKD